MSDIRTLLVGSGDNGSNSSSSEDWQTWSPGFNFLIKLVLGEKDLELTIYNISN